MIHGRCTADFSHIYYLLVFRILCCSGSPLTFYFSCFFPPCSIFFHLKIQYSQIMMFLRLRLCFVCFPSPSFHSLGSFCCSRFNHLSFVDGSKSTFSAPTFQRHLCLILSNAYMITLPESFNVTQQGQISSVTFYLSKFPSCLYMYLFILLFL